MAPDHTPGAPPDTHNLSLRHYRALEAIRSFLCEKSSYDILPESYRLIVFDNQLTIKRALAALIANGVVSAPIYDSTTFKFAGMFTLTDIIHLIQYYYLTATTYDVAAVDVEGVRLAGLREIEETIDVPPPPTLSIHPDENLYKACAALARTHARRLPLIDLDDNTAKETILSVLTQYRVLKFLAINCPQECNRLVDSVGFLGIGTYISSFQPRTGSRATNSQRSNAKLSSTRPRSKSAASSLYSEKNVASSSAPPPPVPQLPTDVSETPQLHVSHLSLEDSSARASATSINSNAPSTATTAESTASSIPMQSFSPLVVATLQTTVFDIVHQFSERGISAVPIVDNDGKVINLYETVDVVDLVRHNAYQALDLTVQDALARRSKDFPGVVTCTPEDSLASILAFIRDKRVHRFVVVEDIDSSGESSTNSEQGAREILMMDKDIPTISGTPLRGRARLVGILCLSDILKHVVAEDNLDGQRWLVDEEDEHDEDEQHANTNTSTNNQQQQQTQQQQSSETAPAS